MAKYMYEWNSLNDFIVWHNQLKQQLNYPLENVNQATGLPNGTFTENYTSPIEVSEKIIAVVEEQYSEGLTLTDLRVPKPE